VFEKFDELWTTGAILEFDGQDDRLLDRLPSLRGNILADAIVDNRPEVSACEFKELGSCGFPNFEVSVGQ
jgi:hypothetical protein